VSCAAPPARWQNLLVFSRLAAIELDPASTFLYLAHARTLGPRIIIWRPRWTTSWPGRIRSSRARARSYQKGTPDVDHSRTQGGSHQELCDQDRRHGVAGGASGRSFGTHQQSDRALQEPRQGQSFPAWTAQARIAASPVARLSRPYRRGALQVVDQAIGDPSLNVVARGLDRALSSADVVNSSAVPSGSEAAADFRDGANVARHNWKARS